MCRIVFADPSQVPELCAIWAAAFPEDPPEAAASFFERVFRPAECLTAVVDGSPVSMVFLLPSALRAAGRTYPLQYIYAAATLPAWRGRGIFGRLLEEALAVGARQGKTASFLRPGEPSLADYYRRFGYRPFFTADVRIPRKDPAGRLPALRRAVPEEYVRCREAFLLDRGIPAWVHWETRLVDYVAGTLEAPLGLYVGRDGCALCDCREGALAVLELLCPPDRRAAWVCALEAAAGLSAGTVVSPVSPEGAGIPFGMWRPLNAAGEELARRAEEWRPYMGLAMD